MKHYYAGSSQRQRSATLRPKSSWEAEHACRESIDQMALRHVGRGATEDQITAFSVGFSVALDIAIQAPELAQWAYHQRIREDVNSSWNDWTEAQYHEDAAEEARIFAGVVAKTGAFDRLLSEDAVTT